MCKIIHLFIILLFLYFYIFIILIGHNSLIVLFMSNDLWFAANKLALVARLLRVQNRPFRPYEVFFGPKRIFALGGFELFMLKTMMRGLEKRCVAYYHAKDFFKKCCICT